MAVTRVKVALPAMLAEERAYGHVFLAIPVIVGLGAAIWFARPTEPAPWLLIGALLICATLSLFLRGQQGWIRHVVLAVLFFLTGMLLAACENWRMATVMLDQPVTTMVTGIVEMREPSGEGRWRYVLALEKTEMPTLRRQPQRVTVISRSNKTVFEIGERIGGRARISPPSGPALPGLVDFAFNSYFDGVGAIGFFYGAPVVADGPVTVRWEQAMERMFFTWRSAIASRIRGTVPGDPGAFAAAIVTDERRAISKETTEALRVSGLAHIVAISGLNMALAAGIFFVGMRSLFALLPGFAQVFPVKKLAAGAALLMATGYYLISGFGVSAERAYIMMAIMLAAVFFDRPSISLRNVALAALVVLVLSPSEILGPSFQMSFAATVALVAGYSAWSRQREANSDDPPWRPPMLKPFFALGHLVGGVFVTSLIGGLSTAIFSIDHFHRLSTYGLAANLAAMPLVSFIVMPFGLIGMLLMPFGLDGPFLKVMGIGLQGVIIVAKTVAGWGGDVGIGRQPFSFLPVATAGFLVLTLLRTRLHLLGLPLLALAIFLSWRAGHDPMPDFLVSEDGSLAAFLGKEQVATNRDRPPGFIYSQWRHALSLPQPIGPALLDIQAPEDEVSAPSSISALLPGNAGAGQQSPGVMSPATQASEGKGTAQKKEGSPDATTPARTRAGREPLKPEALAQARQVMQKALHENPSETFACAARSWCVARSRDGPTIAVVEDARYAGPACDVAQVVIATRARFDRCRSGALMINGEVLRRTGALEIRFNGKANPQEWSVIAAMAGADRSWARHRQYDWRRGVFDPALPEPLQFFRRGPKASDIGE
ncbi:ComEC/Rec2 family competence protein [Endobacterium cereale]|uniref:ComEC/Rec2 family competence protein n=1 Tax=Endobacterium cereale TaxID=2663029 RepID=UPI001F317B1E|nr:ComEC/Rec2 family competence protein [Endobacterium cereale]MEB2843662.1 ComEC/Rec2 family competence protein [Endobacterium cereale]